MKRMLTVLAMLVFLSGCATQHEASGYRRFVKANCEVCGTTKGIQGCHVIPQNVILKRVAAGKLTESEGKYLINDCETNIKSLCRSCHSYIQHIGGNFKRWNANVVETIKSFKEGEE